MTGTAFTRGPAAAGPPLPVDAALGIEASSEPFSQPESEAKRSSVAAEAAEEAEEAEGEDERLEALEDEDGVSGAASSPTREPSPPTPAAGLGGLPKLVGVFHGPIGVLEVNNEARSQSLPP
mmetsp:Transcript_53214/g.95490  ORF Transcript_53214/g.95490 Transcript_53214/m.95490 type:complete len:122 (+) Transcript_53214:303-668(+)